MSAAPGFAIHPQYNFDVPPRFRVIAAAILLTWCALAAVPAATAQSDPRAALLEKAGWTAIAAGDAQAAANHFRDALAGDPTNARLHLGSGLAAYLQGRDSDARSALDRALTLDSGLMAARALLGEVQHRSGDIAAAIATQELVVAAAPGVDGARDTLARWRRELELHDRMQKAIGPHFTVSFEGPAEEALATEALASLDRAYWRIGAILGLFPNTPIPVVLYTREQFRDITRSPAWAAAAFDGAIRVPMRGALEESGELDRILAHEFTHALVRAIAPRGVPAWLNEGLASALEGDDLGWATERVQGAAKQMRVRDLPSTFGRLDGREAQLAYATSAIAVRRVLDEAGGAAIANLLRDLAAGVDLDAAFLHRIQRPLSDY
jgi:tetratricopeptide (TPR) repeat protein